MRLYYKLIFLWVFISACGRHTDWRESYDMTMLAKGSTLYKIKQDGKWGLANANGQVLVAPEYDLISNFDSGFGRIYKNGKMGLVNCNGIIIASEGLYDITHPMGQRIFAVEKNKQWGLINYDGKSMAIFGYQSIEETIFPPYAYSGSYNEKERYEYARRHHTVIVLKGSQKWGIMNSQGNYLIAPQYDSIGIGKNALYIQYKGKMGVWDSTFHQVVPCKYDSINNNILVLNGKYGFMNNHLQVRIEPRYEAIQYLNQGEVMETTANYSSTLRFKQGGKWGLLKDTKVFIAPLYDEIYIRGQYHYEGYWKMTNHYYEVRKNGKMGWLDSLGRTLVPCEYDDIKYTSDKNVFNVFNDDMAGLVKLGGKVLLPPCIKCSSMDNFHAGLARVVTKITSNSTLDICFVTPQGKWVGFPQYDNVGDFSSKGYAFAIKNKKLGFIDTFGNEILPFIYDLYPPNNDEERYLKNVKTDDYFEDDLYDYTSPYKSYGKGFSYGAKIITLNNKYGLIDEFGKWIAPTKYDEIEMLNSTLYRFVWKGKEGLLSKNGKIMLSPKYDYVDLDDNGGYWGRLGDWYYTYAPNGKFMGKEKSVNQ